MKRRPGRNRSRRTCSIPAAPRRWRPIIWRSARSPAARAPPCSIPTRRSIPTARSIRTPCSTPTAIRTSARPTSPRNRGSARSRCMACRPPAAPPIPATTRETASASRRNIIRPRPGPNRRQAPARLHRNRRRRIWPASCASRSRRRRPRTSSRCRRRWPTPCRASRSGGG